MVVRDILAVVVVVLVRVVLVLFGLRWSKSRMLTLGNARWQGGELAGLSCWSCQILVGSSLRYR